MASASAQCITELGKQLKKVGDSAKIINLTAIAKRIEKRNNKSSWFMSSDTVLKEIHFFQSFGGNKLEGVSIFNGNIGFKNGNSAQYPQLRFRNREAVRLFLDEMINCRAIWNSIFCYPGSGRIYKQIRKDIFGS